MNAFASDGYEGFTAALARAGVVGRAVRALSSIVDSPRACSGQLAANGPAGRSPIVTWFDTEAGRYGVKSPLWTANVHPSADEPCRLTTMKVLTRV